jgi:hypothetical protein
MKKWMKITTLTVAVLNLMMLVATLCPTPFVSSQVAFAGDDHPTLKAQPIGGDQPEMVPESCKKIKNCHGFWRCAWQVLKCAADIINS